MTQPAMELHSAVICHLECHVERWAVRFLVHVFCQ